MARQHRGGQGVRVESKLCSPASRLVTWDRPFPTLSHGFPSARQGFLQYLVLGLLADPMMSWSQRVSLGHDSSFSPVITAPGWSRLTGWLVHSGLGFRSHCALSWSKVVIAGASYPGCSGCTAPESQKE